MKMINDVSVRMTTSGKMVVLVKYIDKGKIETKIEPYSEELLLKYKKKYEKGKAQENKIKNKVNMKTNEKVDINTNFFVESALTGGVIILEIAAIGVAAYIGATAILGNFIKDIHDMGSPIIPDDEIEYNIDMHK